MLKTDSTASSGSQGKLACHVLPMASSSGSTADFSVLFFWKLPRIKHFKVIFLIFVKIKVLCFLLIKYFTVSAFELLTRPQLVLCEACSLSV